MDPKSASFVTCANIRSRHQPALKCAKKPTHGEFCFRHWKKPIRYFDRNQNDQSIILTRHLAASNKIKKFWHRYSGLNRFRKYGPAASFKEISQNTTEIYSLEKIQTIPQEFFFSYADAHKNIWAFDIRSLFQLMGKGTPLQNPYTRELLNEKILQKLHTYIEILRKKKTLLLYLDNEAISVEQHWNQRVLDVFLKIEALGYLLNTTWFNSLTVQNHKEFYKCIWDLWQVRLGLKNSQKNEICPGYASSTDKLFRWNPDDFGRIARDLRWWRRQNLSIINNLVTRGTTKVNCGLGALYVLMGLVHVNEDAADAYPWIVESLGLEPVDDMD
jgi:hypothetical protein